MSSASRSQPTTSPGLKVLRPALHAVQAVSPRAAATLAERLFFTAPAGRVSQRGREFLAGGKRFTLNVGGRRLEGWSWGEGRPIYLVHGWGGCAGRLYSLAAPLVATGRKVVMYDAPGHGESSRGMSSMPEFARALRAVVADQGQPEVVVAHSLGAAATAFAASLGPLARRYVFIAPPSNPADWAVAFARTLGLTPEVLRHLRSRSEHRLQFSWDDLDVLPHARGMTAPLLVIHDHNDDTVPWRNGFDIAESWPGARLVETSGLGHREILRDAAVIAEVLAFIDVEAPETVSVGSGNALLEYELFYRDER